MIGSHLQISVSTERVTLYGNRKQKFDHYCVSVIAWKQYVIGSMLVLFTNRKLKMQRCVAQLSNSELLLVITAH